MDLRFKNDAVFQVVGPSGSGKTLFVTNLLSNSGKNYFINKIQNIYWLGDGSEKGLTAQQLSRLKNVTHIEGFENGWMERPQSGDAIVIDDLFVEASKEKNFNNLFTKIARHRESDSCFHNTKYVSTGWQSSNT